MLPDACNIRQHASCTPLLPSRRTRPLRLTAARTEQPLQQQQGSAKPGAGSVRGAVAHPPGQGLHVVLPSRAWYVPAAQRTQRSCFTSGLTVPGAHREALALPTGQKVPTPHSRHCSALVITSRLASIVVPPGHGRGAAEPSAQ